MYSGQTVVYSGALIVVVRLADCTPYVASNSVRIRESPDTYITTSPTFSATLRGRSANGPGGSTPTPMSAHPDIQACPGFTFPTILAFAWPLDDSSSPPGPVLRNSAAMVESPALFHRKHVVPRNTNRSFTPSSSTTFPSSLHETASIRTQGPCKTTSSRSVFRSGWVLGSRKRVL